jgi:DNA-binding MarR family transcriptional regulator
MPPIAATCTLSGSPGGPSPPPARPGGHEDRGRQLRGPHAVAPAPDRASRQGGRRARGDGTESRLSTNQIDILVCVAEQAGIPSKHVAARLGLPRSVVSHGLDRLVAVGLVNRDIDTTDRRRTSLTLTEDGEDFLRRAAVAGGPDREDTTG